MLGRILSSPVLRTLNPVPSRGAQGRENDHHPSTAFPRFIQKLKARHKPALLDLGILCGENIAWLAGHGVKVFVDDAAEHLIESSTKTVKLPDGQVKPAPVEFSHIAYPAGSFDSMLLWNLLDFMDRETAGRFLEKLRFFMKPRCLLFAMCSYDRSKTSAPLTRYRITDENHIAYEEDPQRRLGVHILENRELHDLFSRFEFIKTNLLRNQVRELLVELK